MTVEKKDIDWGSLGFGYMKTDYSYEAHWKDGEWDEGGLTADMPATLYHFEGADAAEPFTLAAVAESGVE